MLQLPNLRDGESVLNLLYEAFDEVNPTDGGTIKEDFNELYRLMNRIPLREMDEISYLVCALCRDHKKSGFVEGVKAGIQLADEMK